MIITLKTAYTRIREKAPQVSPYKRDRKRKAREREEETPKETPILQGKDDISKKFSLFLHFLIEKFGHIKKK
jgi:hypothetical protein